jgi:RimJ/RimL family protein N-acetyltransferase
MEMMPHHSSHSWLSDELVAPPAPRVAHVPLPTFGPVAARDWRQGLPTLATPACTLRDLTLEDAPSLCAHLTTDEVARFISPPPTTVEGFERFIRWAHRRRGEGRYACFAIVPAGETRAVGMFQVHLADDDASVAEWGFVLGSAFWGTGIFLAGARRVLHFVFDQLGIRRLEARAVLENGRGNGALRKVGAVRETVLHGTFERDGERLDQGLWIITRDTWRAAAAFRDRRPTLH